MDNESRTSENREDVPLHELLNSPSVDVIVGEDKTLWRLPERLLTHHSSVFERTFAKSSQGKESKPEDSEASSSKSYTLAEEENSTFELLVAYLYSRTLPTATAEKSVGPLLDLYLLAHQLEMNHVTSVVVDAVRDWYHNSGTYPGLRRVQYIYGNTENDNEMREMMISAVARQLTTISKIPAHWATALQRNGQLAVDIIRAIQQWHIEEQNIPDARDARSRKAKAGFSAIAREADSAETDSSRMVDSAIGLESHDGDNEEAHETVEGKIDAANNDTDEVAGSGGELMQDNMTGLKEVAATA